MSCLYCIIKSLSIVRNVTVQKMKFSIKDFFSKCDQICIFLRIWSHLLKKSLIINFIFRAVCIIVGVLILFSIHVNVCAKKSRKLTCPGFCPVTPLTAFSSFEILRRLKRAFTKWNNILIIKNHVCKYITADHRAKILSGINI